MARNTILITILCIFGPLVGWTQTGVGNQTPVVTVDLNQKHITTAIPFDVPFVLKGKALGYSKISMTYQMTDNCARSHCKLFCRADTVTWNAISVTTSSDTFSLPCPGIQPNTKYKFSFTLTKRFSASAGLADSCKKIIAQVFETYFDQHAMQALADSNIAEISTSLNKQIKTLIGLPDQATLLDPSIGREVDLSLVDNGMKKSFQNFWSDYVALKGDSNTYKTKAKELVDLFDNTLEIIRRQVKNVMLHQELLSAQSKALLTATYNPGLTCFSKYTLTDGLRILEALTNVPDGLQGILEGTIKIDNTNFKDTSGVDQQSVLFLGSTVSLISSMAVTNQAGNDFLPAVTALGEHFKDCVDALESISQITALIQADETKVPNVTLNKYVVETQIQYGSADVDATTSNSPYISADGGIGYDRALRTGFAYLGANFYFWPVNKQAKWRDLKFWYGLKKSLCLNLSVANFWGPRPQNTVSLLGSTSNYDLMAGLGVRLGRVIKVNFDVLPYRTNNAHPFINDYALKYSGCVTIGIDVNLLKGFTSVATALKINQ
jgi:hypothetical protein